MAVSRGGEHSIRLVSASRGGGAQRIARRTDLTNSAHSCACPAPREAGSVPASPFDRMGRRVEYLETTSAEESVISDGITNIVVTVTTNAHYRFVYDGYLCIQRLNALSNNAVDLAFGWDPSEPVATRPLWMQRVSGTYNFFYFHDGNKNVSDVVSFQQARGVPAHYEYAPFGAVTAVVTNTAITTFNVAATNPYRFSSEYADDALGLVYYNYRHYEPVMGRWLSRDPLDSIVMSTSLSMYCFIDNDCCSYDYLGLAAKKGISVEKVNRDFVITDDAVVEYKNVDVIKPNVDKQRAHGASLANAGWNLYGLSEAFIKLKIKCQCLTAENSTILRHYLVGTLQLDVLVQYIGEGKTVEIRLGGQKKSVVRTSEGVAKTLAHEDFHTEFFKEEYKKLVSAIKETYSPNGYATSQDCEKVKIEINSLVYKKQVVLDTDKGETNHSSERWKNWIQTNGGALP